MQRRPSGPFVVPSWSRQDMLFAFYSECLEATLGLIKLMSCGHNLLILVSDGVCLERLRLCGPGVADAGGRQPSCLACSSSLRGTPSLPGAARSALAGGGPPPRGTGRAAAQRAWAPGRWACPAHTPAPRVWPARPPHAFSMGVCRVQCPCETSPALGLHPLSEPA